jgi:hypothetical protein
MRFLLEPLCLCGAAAYSCRGALNRWNSNSAPPRSANIARNGSVMTSRTSPSTIRITSKIAEIMSSGYPRLGLGSLHAREASPLSPDAARTARHSRFLVVGGVVTALCGGHRRPWQPRSTSRAPMFSLLDVVFDEFSDELARARGRGRLHRPAARAWMRVRHDRSRGLAPDGSRRARRHDEADCRRGDQRPREPGPRQCAGV